MAKQTYEHRGTVDRIYDARAMSVGGKRISAPYGQDLTDVTTGGDLTEGVQVVVKHTVNGKWNNAETIQVIGNAAPNAARSPVDPTAKGGKHNRIDVNYRHPDELNRVEMTKLAVKILTVTGELQAVPNQETAVIKVTSLSELLQAFVEDTVDATFIKDQLGPVAGAQKPAQTDRQPPWEDKAPTPEAQAALEASAQPAASETAGDDVLARFING